MPKAISSAGPGRILVVDLDPSVFRPVATFLKRDGYNVDIAASGRDALSLARSIPFDLALIDFPMPGISGADLVRALHAASVHFSVIAVKGQSTPPTHVEFQGVDAFVDVQTPFDLNELMLLIYACLPHRPTSGGTTLRTFQPDDPLNIPAAERWARLVMCGLRVNGDQD